MNVLPCGVFFIFKKLKLKVVREAKRKCLPTFTPPLSSMKPLRFFWTVQFSFSVVHPIKSSSTLIQVIIIHINIYYCQSSSDSYCASPRAAWTDQPSGFSAPSCPALSSFWIIFPLMLPLLALTLVSLVGVESFADGRPVPRTRDAVYTRSGQTFTWGSRHAQTWQRRWRVYIQP